MPTIFEKLLARLLQHNIHSRRIFSLLMMIQSGSRLPQLISVLPLEYWHLTLKLIVQIILSIQPFNGCPKLHKHNLVLNCSLLYVAIESLEREERQSCPRKCSEICLLNGHKILVQRLRGSSRPCWPSFTGVSETWNQAMSPVQDHPQTVLLWWRHFYSQYLSYSSCTSQACVKLLLCLYEFLLLFICTIHYFFLKQLRFFIGLCFLCLCI